MDIGIFSKVYKDDPLEEALQKIKKKGMDTVQFNFANVGLPSLPQSISPNILQQIQKAVKTTGIRIPVVSATFNILGLDPDIHKKNIHCFSEIVKAAATLEIPNVSISTGSFNQEDFWSPHPDNHTEKAWKKLYQSMDEMLEIASKEQIVIVVEPEQANVVSTVEDTKKLLAHYDYSPYLKVLFDGANIVSKDDAEHLAEKISASIDELHPYIAIAHCKDCFVTNEKIIFKPVGKGNLPLKAYLEKLQETYHGPIIMHGLDESDVDFALQYLNEN